MLWQHRFQENTNFWKELINFEKTVIVRAFSSKAAA